MPFSALVNLGPVIGSGISGQNVSISGCTGASCGSGCTPLVSAQAVSSFPKQISISDDNVVSLFVRVDGGSCAGTTQCITITTGTPSPTPTATSVGPTPTATAVQPTPTATPLQPTPTATPLQPTPTSTPVPPTPTPTSTSAPTDCNIVGTASVSPGTPTQFGQIILQSTGRIMNLSVFGGASTGSSSSLTLTVTGSGPTPNPVPNSVTITASAYQSTQGTLTLPIAGTYNYTLTISANGTSGNNGSFSCGNPYIAPTATPVPPTATPSACVDGVGFEVDVAGQVRYVTCAGITEYVTLGTGPQFISGCIQNNSLFSTGAQISQVSYGSPCVVSPTPTPTSTPPTELEPTPTLEQTQWCYTYNNTFTQQTQTYGPFGSQQECQTASNNAGHFAICYQCIGGAQN